MTSINEKYGFDPESPSNIALTATFYLELMSVEGNGEQIELLGKKLGIEQLTPEQVVHIVFYASLKVQEHLDYIARHGVPPHAKSL